MFDGLTEDDEVWVAVRCVPDLTFPSDGSIPYYRIVDIPGSREWLVAMSTRVAADLGQHIVSSFDFSKEDEGEVRVLGEWAARVKASDRITRFINDARTSV
ncbi:hypothetical protein RRF57_003466 [Xylaria bambusicola]|uniref:Uncharacterized protein n=1 Tax=Xylaria bambusicola TaxID=326684 RepID=A0AAN7UKA2_9PEZI